MPVFETMDRMPPREKMPDIATLRADRSAIRKSILEVLKQTADSYALHGDPNTDLRDAPEYLINVNLAQGLAAAFPTLRFRLEHPASTYEHSARQTVDARAAVGKDAARFDVVLLNRQTGVPRYIIEVKRGIKIIGDAERIISIAALDSGRRRWRHGYLVTIIRRTESDMLDKVAQLVSAIGALRATKNAQLPDHQHVVVKHDFMRIGKARQDADGKAIFGVVFQVSLVDRKAPDIDQADESGE